MKPILPTLFLFLLSATPTLADTAPSYVELTDRATITADWSEDNTQAVTLHGNRSLIFMNGQKGGTYRLIIKQDATGSRLVTWPPSVHWPGVGAPTLTTTANKKDYFTFIYDGVEYDAVAFSQNY